MKTEIAETTDFNSIDVANQGMVVSCDAPELCCRMIGD